LKAHTFKKLCNMKKLFVVAGISAICIFTSCSKDQAPGNNMNGVNNTDTLFMNNVAKGNNGEVMAAQLATQKGNLASVKSFAQFMITEHSQAQTDLQNVANNIHYTLPSGTAPEDSALMVQLNSLSGKAFDSVYMNAQVMDHQKTRTIFQNEINNGSQPAVKTYANNYLPHIQTHLSMADSIAKTIH
jgi:putative membrane protein